MKPSFYLYAFVVFLLVFGLVKAVRAGGADESIDPLNGCFAKADASGGDPKNEADFINNRGKYSLIVGRDRFLSNSECWNGKARCLNVSIECYRNGKIVYTDVVKFWRVKK